MTITPKLSAESGYGWVTDRLAPLSPFGRAAARAPIWYGPDRRGEWERELDNVAAALALYREGHHALGGVAAALNAFRDPGNSLRRPADSPMDEVELFEIKGFLLSLRALARSMETLPPFPGIALDLEEELLDLLDPSGRRLPPFSLHSPALEEIRAEKRALEDRLRTLQGEEREALLETRRALTVREDGEEWEVRRALTARVLAHRPRLEANMAAVGALDLLLAKARLARRFSCVRPRLSGEKIAALGMVHPQVAAALAEQELSFTPLDITMKMGSTVLTGANMGGKSVALRTVTLNQLLMQTGFFVFARDYAAPLFHSVSLLLADGQSAEGGLSSFGAEVTELDRVLRESKPPFFLAADEFARGTNPREGAALARALAGYLNGLNCVALLTTHYDGVSSAAGGHYRVAGLRPDAGACEGKLAELMDYRLLPAPPHAPCPRDALRVCRLLGLEGELVELFAGAVDSEPPNTIK